MAGLARLQRFQHTAARRRLDVAYFVRLLGLVRFQHTAARRRLLCRDVRQSIDRSFNTQPPEGGWVSRSSLSTRRLEFQHTAARRRLVAHRVPAARNGQVSTHSRPKAAGACQTRPCPHISGFNTQPPEGGWSTLYKIALFVLGFNTQPPEGGWG